MFKVNITDGNISSVLDDVALIQAACNKNSMALVKTAFNKYGLVLNKEGAYDISYSAPVITISNISPIIFQDGYYVDPNTTSLTIQMPTVQPSDIYVVVKEYIDSGVNIATLQLVAMQPDSAPIYTRAVKLYTISSSGATLIVNSDCREVNSAILERNPFFTKSAPTVSSVTTSYNYDSITDGKDFTHVNQRLAFLMIKWSHASDCNFIVRICPCNSNRIEESMYAEYILCMTKSLMFEAIDGKMYTIKVQARDEDGSSQWSDVYSFIAGSDRVPVAVTTPQVVAEEINEYPTVISITVSAGTRDYPFYIEVYKNDKLLYTGPESTVTAILDVGETAFFKARVKGPNECSSEMVSTGFFEGAGYNPDFNGQPSSLVLSVPISFINLAGRPTYDTLYAIRSIMLPMCDIVKLTFDSKGSYADASVAPNPVISLEVSKSDYSVGVAVDVSEIYIGDGTQIDNYTDYYKFFISEPLERSVDPDEEWLLNIRINTDQANTTFNITGTLHIHYRLKNSWLA